jgi:D-alanyl-D-alanine carboxypeptidase
MNRFQPLLLGTGLLLAIPARSQSPRQEADSIRISRGVPGMAFAVFSPDSVLESGIIGYRRFGSRDSLCARDRFHIGINTTAFTSYIAACLVEAGKLKWTTPLLEIFPEFRKKCAPVYRDIRFKDLLGSRTRVIPFMDPAQWDKMPDSAGTGIIRRRRAFTGRMLRLPPDMANAGNDRIVFSLAGYVMATAMMEKVTGYCWEELLTRYVRKPLKLSLHYSWPFVADSVAPAGHRTVSGRFTVESRTTAPRTNAVLYPARDISISLGDYVRFMQENLAGLTGGHAHLKQSTFEYLYFGLPDYAMGWNNGSMNNQSYAYHEGLSLLYSSRAELVKEKKRGIVVLANSGDPDGRAAVLWVSRELERRYY